MNNINDHIETWNSNKNVREAIENFSFIIAVASEGNLVDEAFLTDNIRVINQLFSYKEAIEDHEKSNNTNTEILEDNQRFFVNQTNATFAELFENVGERLMLQIGYKYKDAGENGGADSQIAILKEQLNLIEDDFSKKVFVVLLIRTAEVLNIEDNNEFEFLFEMAIEHLHIDVSKSSDWFINNCLPLGITLY